ncbi:hypothetical protein Acsp01_84960 [Actinoplanes sp. NBRC 101535]|nr:hypothetical protein Acsp01_84960 [Actinoplanes sp. NBRC 101535]
MRHPAEGVVLFEDEHPVTAELGDRAGRGQAAHPGADHDDVGLFLFDHPPRLAGAAEQTLNGRVPWMSSGPS